MNDLSPEAIKAARRLQALPEGRLYLAVIAKVAKMWLLALLTPQGAKVERIKRGDSDAAGCVYDYIEKQGE